MATSLKVLRTRTESERFERLAVDDSRTAIPPGAAEALAADLKKVIHGEVRFDRGTRALYSTDGSNYRQVPIGVVIPRHTGDVQATIELARKHGAPILSRGGGTSLAGQCCNVAVVMDFSKYMHGIIEIDAGNKLARVQPGCVLDDLRNTAKRQHGLIFAPDPETHSHCTIGGMLGNNSCGVHSLMARNNGMGLRMSDNTHAMEVLSYEGHRFAVGPTSDDEWHRIIRAGGPQGEIYAKMLAFRDKYADAIRAGYPKLERRVSGYNLNDLLPENGGNIARALVGSESTLVTILEATVVLVPNPKARSLLLLGYPDIASGADHVMEILEFKPIGLEGIDHLLFKFVKDKGDENANLALFPPGGGFLLVEFGGDSQQDADDQARCLMDHLKKKGSPPTMKLVDDPKQAEMIWKVREGSLGSTAWVPGMPDTWEGWEDSAVPVPKIGDYLRDLRKLLDKYDYHPTLYGHLGQGCVHTRIPFDLYTEPGIRKWRSFIDEATDLVVKYGGSFSGEHGDGQSRGEWLPKMFSPQLMEAMHEFKRIWDPQWKMNPGKVLDPYSMTENLRVGPDYNPPQPRTHFNFPADRHSFARASLRCVGVGECRREGGGTMCPSYMVTREEKHSTRGRARLLFEMMNGEVIEDGWKSEEVKEALDLCLACKGCKGDCPVNVDMATYKAEFLSHYYEGKLRPRYAYAFGWIHVFSKLASYAPNFANLVTQTPGLSAIAKFVAGINPKRKIPAFAPQTFQQWLAEHNASRPAPSPGTPGEGRGGGPLPNPPPEYRERGQQRVLLFPDTFNNFYHLDTAIATVEVLEDAGFRVETTHHDVCCGRPLYDYGFLGMAKRWLEDLIAKLRPQIRAGVPIVVMEPSCWAVFKDELTNILNENEDAKRLQDQIYTLSDFLEKHSPHYRAPSLRRKAVLHGHCHQKALDKLNDKRYGELFAEKDLLKKMGVEFEAPVDGCCGMAGAFGFEAEHYDTAMKCGERSILPSVRKADDDAIVIADGFSCREQIRQGSDREALHLAQVMQLSLRHGPDGPREGRPESELLQTIAARQRRGRANVIACLAAGAVIGGILYARASRIVPSPSGTPGGEG